MFEYQRLSLATKSLSSSSGNSEYLVRAQSASWADFHGEHPKIWSKPETCCRNSPLKLIWRQDHLVGGFNLPLWKMMEFFSWDDEIPNISNILYGNIWKVIKFHGSSHHQSQSLWSKTVRVPKRNWTSSLRTVTATPLLQDPLALRTKGRSCNERLGISTETRKAEGTSMFRCLSGFWFVHKQWKRYELWDEQKI